LPAADLLSTNDLSGLRLQSITFSGASGGYALRGNAITLTNGISSANTAGDNDVDFDITRRHDLRRYGCQQWWQRSACERERDR
jgi:hypothetical protein